MRSTVAILDCDFGRGEIEREILEPLGFRVVLGHASSESEVLEISAGAAGLLTQYAPVTRTVLEARPELRAVVRYGVGVDCIDTVAAQELGVSVSGVNDYCTDEVADHAMALLLSAIRSICVSDRQIKSGGWPIPTDLPLIETLKGKTLGLIGFGRIAQALAERAQAFGCDVIAYDPFVDASLMGDKGVAAGTFEETLGASIVSLHLPANDQTKRIIDGSALRKMRRGAILVNVSRGALVDESSLEEALDTGHIGYGCLDVFEDEGPARSSLARHARVVATPHSGYYSPRALQELRRRATLNLAALLQEASV